ncbi:MAG: hypothetical protein WAM69_18845 [Candidatus Sulfotelmatobacter sp.]
MNPKLIFCCFALSILPWTATALGQTLAAPVAAVANGDPQYSVQGSAASAPSPPQGAPVSYASMTQLNGLLSRLEATSQTTQADLMNLRIERWRTAAASKKQSLDNVDSILRNLQDALPEIIGQLRNAPEDIPATFKLYRNLDALYDVLGSVVESTGAFGSKDNFQSVANDLDSFESTRRQLAERLENLATAKEQEIARLRAELKTAQAAIPVAPPKKIIVDDTEPVKKPAVRKRPLKKKPEAAKPPAAATPPPAPPQ